MATRKKKIKTSPSSSSPSESVAGADVKERHAQGASSKEAGGLGDGLAKAVQSGTVGARVRFVDEVRRVRALQLVSCGSFVEACGRNLGHGLAVDLEGLGERVCRQMRAAGIPGPWMDEDGEGDS